MRRFSSPADRFHAHDRAPAALAALCASSLVAGSLVTTSSARAQCPPGAITTLTDSASFAWDVNDAGAVVDGTSNAFDGLYTLTISGTAFMAPSAPTTELGGRQLVYGPMFLITEGLAIRRRVYVPSGEAWARWIDEVTNTGTSMNTVTLEIRLNSGADDRMEIVSTSDGDLLLEATDRTFVLDNELTPPPEPPMETLPPATCHVAFGAGARIAPTSLSTGAGFNCRGTEGATLRFRLDLPPATTMRVMYFAAQGALRADASARCDAISVLPAAAFADISGADRAQIVNWPIALPVGSPCTTPSGCGSGFCVDGFCCESACGGGALGDCEACSRGAGSTAASDGMCGVARSTYACRPELSPCDLPERCDGTGRVCPADAFRGAGLLCRPAASGSCDLPEACDGTSGACPTDRFEAADVVCDTFGTTPCWMGGRCTGTNASCPLARMQPDRSLCDDTVPCTVAECMSGGCLPIGATCDDGDPCTTDTCPDAVMCSHLPVAGCDGGVPPRPDGGPPEFQDAGADLDAGADFDGGGLDAGLDLDAGGLDGSTGRMDATPRRDGDPLTTGDLAIGGGGCVCRAGAGGGPRGPFTVPLLALLMLASIVVRRRARAAGVSR